MYLQLKDVKGMNGIQGKFAILNQQLEEVGEIIQYDYRVELFIDGEVVMVDDHMKDALEKFKNLYENNIENKAIELYKQGKIVDAIRLYNTFVGINMNIKEVRDYLKNKVK